MHDLETLKTDYHGGPSVSRCTVPGGWVYSIKWSAERTTTTFVPHPDGYLGNMLIRCGFATPEGSCVLGEGHRVGHTAGR